MTPASASKQIAEILPSRCRSVALGFGNWRIDLTVDEDAKLREASEPVFSD
jgi:hypothetical protein